MKYATGRKYLTNIIIIVLTLMFIMAGSMKVSGSTSMIEGFIRFNLPLWFMYVIGMAEIFGAVALWIPRLSSLSALGLIIIMSGAFVLHVMHDPLMQAIPAFVLGVLLAIVFKIRLPEFHGKLKEQQSGQR